MKFDFEKMLLRHFCGLVNYPVLCQSTGILAFLKVLKKCVCGGGAVYICVAKILPGLLFVSRFYLYFVSTKALYILKIKSINRSFSGVSHYC